jgi:4'-phosphopantetheinyl transferase
MTDPLPPPEASPRVLRLAGVGPRPQARAATRQAIRATLARWYGQTIELVETPRGPAPDPASPAGDIRISVTYACDDAWVAFHRGPVGLDACPLEDFPERDAVARLYLPALPPASDLAAFALAWTSHEARLKLAGLRLTEGAEGPPTPQLSAWTEGGTSLALAWG